MARQVVWVHPHAWPWSDTHCACAGVIWSHHQSASGLSSETGCESQACSSGMGSLGGKFLMERELGWEVCPVNIRGHCCFSGFSFHLFSADPAVLPLPICAGMSPGDTTGTAALPCRLEGSSKAEHH